MSSLLYIRDVDKWLEPLSKECGEESARGKDFTKQMG